MTATPYLEPPLCHVSVAGGTIAVREAGEGNRLPLVLLHGIGSNSIMWGGQFEGLAHTRRVIAWNAPGYFGSTPLTNAIPTADDYGATLLALLDALAVDRAILVGQSLGAIIATAVALRQPERVAGLVLASPAAGYAVPAGEPPPPRVAARIDEVVTLGSAGLADRRAHRLLTATASPDARAIVHRAMSEVTVEGYVQASHMLAHADLLSMVAHVRAPALVLWGEEDIITPPAGCARIAAAFPEARSASLPKLGHGFATEAPAAFNANIASFVDALEPVPVD